MFIPIEAYHRRYLTLDLFKVPLSLGQLEFEWCGSTYTWIFLYTYSAVL